MDNILLLLLLLLLLLQVLMVERSREDEVLVMASDGLWDVIGNQEAADMAVHSLQVRGLLLRLCQPWFGLRGLVCASEAADMAVHSLQVRRFKSRFVVVGCCVA
jgi:hypothetical protein